MKRALVGLALVCVALLLGCDQPAGGKPEPTVSAVTVSPATASIARGGSREFSAAVAGENDPDPAVTWKLAGAASAGTGFSDGVLIVDEYEEADELTLTATSKADPSKSGAATVAVTGAAIGEEESFTVSFNSQGGSAVAKKAILDGGKVSQPPNPARTGYAFAGWYAEASCVNPWDFETPITGAMTLYAKWTTDTTAPDLAQAKAALADAIAAANAAKDGVEVDTASGNVLVGTAWATQAAVDAFAAAIAAAQAAYDDADATQAQLGGAAAALSSAAAAFAAATHDGTKPIPAGKAGLADAIAAANAAKNSVSVNTAASNVAVGATWATQAAVDTFAAAIAAAKTMFDNASAAQAQVDGAAATLSAATTAFNAAKQGGTKLPTYTVSFNSQGGSAVPAQTVASGGTASQPPTPSKGTDIFGGWYTAANGGGTAWSFGTAVTAAITLYAKWSAAAPVYDEGDIYSAAELAKIGVDYPRNGAYRLVADITLANWTPICADAAHPFAGSFDGNNHTITIQSFSNAAVQGRSYLGIFGYVRGQDYDHLALIKDVKIVSSVSASSTKDGGQAVGLVAGYANRALIQGIALSGSLGYSASIGVVDVGGVAGWIEYAATVKNSTSSLNITVSGGFDKPLAPNIVVRSNLGGFVGYLQNNAAISNCNNSGTVTGNAPVPAGRTVGGGDPNSVTGPTTNDPNHAQVFAGGIAGGNFNGGGQVSITGCTSTGNVTATAAGYWAFAAGIMGGGSATLANCAASGTLKAAAQYAYAGGMSAYGGSFTNCAFSGTIAKGSYYAKGPMDGHANGTGAAASGADGSGNTWAVPWYEE
jgi:uncharacterized repeat protein (TIGR02543 family)